MRKFILTKVIKIRMSSYKHEEFIKMWHAADNVITRLTYKNI